MSDIKLKNNAGVEQTYAGVRQIVVKGTDGSDKIFTEPLGFTVTFISEPGVVYCVQNNPLNQPTYPVASPTREGYWFMGWSAVSHDFVSANRETLPHVYNSNKTLYAMWLEIPVSSAAVTGLGSEASSAVQFNVDSSFPTSFPEVTDAFGNIFIKIPTMYRKVVEVTDNQITSMIISTAQVDSSYYPYPCFIKEDGITVMPYILIGKYCMSSSSVANSVSATPVSMTIGAGRTLARNLGTGYQLYDWQMRQLFNDLVIVARRSVNVNANPLIGIDHLANDIWVDGFAHNNTDWIFSYKPSKYVDNPTSATDGYNIASYSCPSTSGQEIKKLGYDSDHPFFNNVSEVISDSAYNSYYYDGWYYAGGNRPVCSGVSNGHADRGLFISFGSYAWSPAYRVRLCYRPINE